MKKSYLMLLFVAMFALVSCNYNESEVVVNTTEKSNDAIVDGKVSLSRAISNADFVFKNTEGLGNKTRKIKSVDVLKRANANSRVTRTSSLDEQDALAYVVNYDNNEGFAILAATTKLPPVISIGDEGNFNTEGFVNFIQNNGATRSGEEINPAQEVQYAVVSNSLLLQSAGFGDLLLRGVDTTIMLKCLPLVKTKWDQDPPYDYYSPVNTDKPGEKCAAGCAPIAAAQTLSALCYHHNWRPTVQLSEDYYMDWYVINRIIYNDIIKFFYYDNSSDALAVASFIRAIGEDMNAAYGTETTAYLSDLKNTYEKLGLLSVRSGNETSFFPVSRNKIFDMIISENYPVTTEARRETRGTTSGHAFVLDGWLRLEYSLIKFDAVEISPGVMDRIEDNLQRTIDLVHVNFGWGGYCDGYYLPDAFDLNADKYREYAEEDDDPSNISYVYDLNVHYVVYSLQ